MFVSYYSNNNLHQQERGTMTEPPPRVNFSATANQVCKGVNSLFDQGI